jgi:type II secretion system protein G
MLRIGDERVAHQARSKRPGERGFTLVELMVVVAIVALLAAIIIPNYVHARAQAAVAQTQANLKQIATALELYYGDNQAYPKAGTVGPTMFGGATNPYLTATPVNALGRHMYSLANSGGTGGAPPSYTLSDPDAYDPTTLQSLPSGSGTGTPCGSSGCTHVDYSPQDGMYGLP